MEELCADKKFRFVYAEVSPFYYHGDSCTNMDKSRISAPVDEPTMKEQVYRNEVIELKANDKGEKEWTTYAGIAECANCWIAYRYVEQGVWVDHYTRHPSNYTNWGSFDGEESNYSPPGSCIWGETLNASEIAGKTHDGGGGKWTINSDCIGFGWKCAMCEKLTQPILRLRGLFEDSQISDLFIPVNDEKGTLGYHNVLIQ